MGSRRGCYGSVQPATLLRSLPTPLTPLPSFLPDRAILVERPWCRMGKPLRPFVAPLSVKSRFQFRRTGALENCGRKLVRPHGEQCLEPLAPVGSATEQSRRIQLRVGTVWHSRFISVRSTTGQLAERDGTEDGDALLSDGMRVASA